MQIIKNLQTKCMKDKWFRSSFEFDTISLKQILPLTQSVVLWNSWTFATQDKMIYNTEKKHTKSVLYKLLYISFSLFDSNECTKYFLSERVFQKLFFMNEELRLYTLLNKHTVLEKTTVYRLTYSKNKIIKYYY